MSNLTDCVKTGRAEVSAYLLNDGGIYVAVCASGLTSDLIWLEERQTFGWWWAGEDRPHAFRALRIEEDDYQTVLYYDGGKLEIFGLWNDAQEAQLDAWNQEKPTEAIKTQLSWYTEQVSFDQVAPVVQGAWQQYQVMIEMGRIPDRKTWAWAVIGAWAANETEIEFYALPRYAGQAEYWRGQIRSALATAGQPLAILDYWLERENGTTTMRVKRDSVWAESALGAAIKAAREAATEIATAG